MFRFFKQKKYNVLILGSNGMLGYDVYNFFKHIVSQTPDSEIGIVTGFDISQGIALDTKDGLRKFFEKSKVHYDFCINCVAYTNTSKAENYKEGYAMSYRLNALAPKYIARACEAFKVKLIHISTDYVFSQFSENGICKLYPVEFSNLAEEFPCNMYGLHKLIGEQFIEKEMKRSANYMCLRISWLYGNHNNKSFIHKFLKNVYQAIKENKTEVEMTENEVSVPTSTVCMNCYISKIIHNFNKMKFLNLHHFHAVPKTDNRKGVSRVEFAEEILKLFGTYEGIKFDSIKVKPIQRETYQPTFSAMKTSFENFPNWKTYLRGFITAHKYDIMQWLKTQ